MFRDEPVQFRPALCIFTTLLKGERTWKRDNLATNLECDDFTRGVLWQSLVARVRGESDHHAATAQEEADLLGPGVLKLYNDVRHLYIRRVLLSLTLLVMGTSMGTGTVPAMMQP